MVIACIINFLSCTRMTTYHMPESLNVMVQWFNVILDSYFSVSNTLLHK